MPAANWMNGIQPLSSSFLGSKKEAKNLFEVSHCIFNGGRRGGLTSFVTERSKQERCHRFDAVDADLGALPPRPPPSINGGPSPHRLLPALPCRPGETLLPQRETYCLAEKVHQVDRFLFSAHVTAGSVARTPGPQGRAGRPGLERWPTGFLGLESRG